VVAGADIQFERNADLAHRKPLRMFGNKAQHPQGTLHRLQYIALYIRSKRIEPLDMKLARHRKFPLHAGVSHVISTVKTNEYRSYAKYSFQLMKVQGDDFSI
jgi:hypothetical protein